MVLHLSKDPKDIAGVLYYIKAAVVCRCTVSAFSQKRY